MWFYKLEYSQNSFCNIFLLLFAHSGTTAHVGISLYGRESRSGHRHLDSKGAFARNALDIFQIATDNSLGSVWKIRIWHDNKGEDMCPNITSRPSNSGTVLASNRMFLNEGLSPAWMLQYVLVKDLQTESSYYFLVEEWLSVDNKRTGGLVEIEVEATGNYQINNG